MKITTTFLLFLVVTFSAVGCGGPQNITGLPVHPASGKVTFKGKPIVDGTVVLHPVIKPAEDENFYPPRGSVQADGTFQLSTYSTQDGAPAGEYKVAFDWTGSHKGLSEDQIDELDQLLPKKYTSAETSGFTVTISEGENQLQEFNLQ